MKKFVFTICAAALACACLAAAGAAAAAHKFHTSFTEADYNPDSGLLEVTLRTFPDDIEAALRRRGVRPARGKEYEEQVFAYVRETFRLKSAAGEEVKLSWVGMDAGVDSAWLYFEARLPAGPEGAQLRNQFLFDLFDDQINLVNVKASGRRAALRFERGAAGFKALALK